VAGPIGARTRCDSRAVHLVVGAGRQLLDEPRRGSGVIGRVTVDQNIDVGLHCREHPANDVPFPLPTLSAHDRAGSRRDFRRPVSRIVVVNVNMRLGQALSETPHDSLDGRSLVVARDQHGNRQRRRRPDRFLIRHGRTGLEVDGGLSRTSLQTRAVRPSSRCGAGMARRGGARQAHGDTPGDRSRAMGAAHPRLLQQPGAN
jgi:hypothetical protein